MIEEKPLESSKTWQVRCPMGATLDVIGGRWKGLILYNLLEDKKRFGELRRLVPEASQRILTLQLRELEHDGVIHREVFKQVPSKVEYSLTEFGKTLEPLLLMMCHWGGQYLSAQRSPPFEVNLGE
ncbi:MAG: transcriptional regulator [Capsulimonas sp.]|jgi:DNA-binding HxlR family transcriptional regulator|nr:transcriptional regulator [Capsulimonas sp.]